MGGPGVDDHASQRLHSVLPFLATALSATASVIVALAAKKDGSNYALLVFCATFFAILGGAWLLMFVTRTRSERKKYDVFISTPMASFSSNEEYQEHRQNIRRIIDALERNYHFNVYYAGMHLPSQESFQQPDVGARQDSAALRQSTRFLLIMPLPLVSSCYVEAGYALALGKPSIYYHHREVELPFMLRQSAQYNGDFPRCKKYEYSQIEDIVRHIESNESLLFD